MGCGKTTLGNAVARRASLRAVDLDEQVERRAGMTIAEIFATAGEEAFRRMEREALRATEGMEDVVVACGGGAPCRPGMMEAMKRSGTVVWLQAPVDVIMRRLLEAPAGQRPLVASQTGNGLEEYVERSMAERRPHYALAHHTFDSSRLESEAEIEASVGKFINQFITNQT